MIEIGKRQYILSQCMPTASDTLLLGYTSNQLKAIQENKSDIWSFLSSQNRLFSVDPSLTTAILKEAPYNDYFGEISKHHSIEVMNKEVAIFLKKQKKNAIILDVGAGWCWHWRILNKLRPDIKIIALDFIKENFIQKRVILKQKNYILLLIDRKQSYEIIS
jgi:hypothetical protein